MRGFIEELAIKGHNSTIRQMAQNLINAEDNEIIEFLKKLANDYYCTCNYCEEKTAAKIVLKNIEFKNKE